jgi:putative peptide zinc metalloprotease protein
MNDAMNSPQWYRVSNLKPRLHQHVAIHRQEYRGLIWYLLENTTTGRNHRFNPAAYLVIGYLDGKRSVDEIYQLVSEQLADQAPGQHEILQLLGQLHAADLMQTDIAINTEELFERQARQSKDRLRQRFLNPVTLKIPLWDPEDFLQRHFDKVRWIFTPWMGLLWIMLMVYSLSQALQNWASISQHFSINALTPYNLLLMFLLYPVIKILHELGHAFSAKLEGGEVHEMGVNFLLLMPVPYVNVSAATHFRNKYKRMLVSAAGILVESSIAAVGLLLFLASEAGVVQNIGFDMFIIGGVSSLFFNANPLLKYDGYYILSDAIGIPNLYQRSAQYWQYFFKRYLLGLKQVSSPVSAAGEVYWFIGYSLASLFYRLGVLWFIFVLVAEKFFLLGVILSLWLVAQQLLLPLYRAMHFMLTNSAVKKHRGRALMGSMAVIVVLVGLIGFVPIPSYTLSEGVVWQPEEGLIKARHDGFVGPIKLANGQQVQQGNTVLQLNDPFLQSKLKIAEARLNELKNQYRAKRIENPVEAGLIREEVGVAESEYAYLQDQMNSMALKANVSGTLVIPQAEDLPGRFVHQGEVLGYVVDKPASTVHMAVSQDHIGQLRQQIKDIRIRFANDTDTEYSASIISQAPEATNQLPHAALSIAGGGSFIVTGDSNNPLLALQKVFLVDLRFDPGQQNIPFGTRAYVRIDHGGEPLATQVMRRVRQIFLRQFNV